MHRTATGATLLSVTLIALTAIPSRAASLQVYAGVVGGSDNSCTSGGATPTAITSFFGSDTTGFGLPLTGNGISSCGLSGQINNVTQSAGPLNPHELMPLPVRGRPKPVVSEPKKLVMAVGVAPPEVQLLSLPPTTPA